ncbi:DVU_1551 family NTP transferase [Tepidibacter hydrothermalis]|uniref:NTP transferase domain-containing protein n=1 Tax=Tepidibacter hydrothermalis TaxID=3036126 RepID=A0ABY8EGJ0_9FIRM|nr:NTP transferase domain-containing protein [Tepidibacter hydrothermalis]WFD12067.1 NTP transferase domain-containing protein [Tepidibacter hydrothermalis]
MKKYAAIILSAGYSSRMGEFKPLMDLYGQTALERTISIFKECNIDNIYIVAGYKYKEIKNFVKDYTQVIYNKDFDKGMLESVKTGVGKLSDDIDAFFVLPVDIPSIKPSTIKSIIDVYEKGNYTVVYPTFSQEKGHPPLICTSISKEILEYSDFGGLKNILSFYEENSGNVQVADRGILLDMDKKEDYKVILDHMSYFPYPDELECREIIRICKVENEIELHMKCVGKLSKIIAEKLNEKGFEIDVDLTYTGGLLHDIGKGKKEHAKQGAMMVSKLGYPCVSEVIKDHMDIPDLTEIGEREVVYISDKLLKDTYLIDIEERYQSSLDKYKDYPDIIKNINKRFDTARKIKNRIEEIIECKIEELQESVCNV